ncbi:hypothetical protein ACS0TY_023797 [Phlomoides rotata]
MEGAKIFQENGPPEEASSEAKIIARPSPEDDYAPSVPSPHHRRCVSVDATTTTAKVPQPKSSFKNPDKVQIDTAAPFESVKAAVSKFGGIVDWKAHRVHTVERRKVIEIELEKAQEEMPSYKQQCDEAEEAKAQVLKELESTKRLIEELKLNLERAQTEEQQAKQDSELAKLRVEEMEQGIADDSSFAAKAQLEVAKARHAAAVSDLKAVRDELEQLRNDYALLIAEKDAAEATAQEAASASKQAEKAVETLTIQLITLKQSLDSEHSTHLEAEEHRMGAVLAKEQDSLSWELELKQTEEELHRLNLQMLSTKDLRSKLADATSLLQELKAELAAYMESETAEAEAEEDPAVPKTRGDIEAAVAAAKKDLLDVKLKIEKATDAVNAYKVASTSLKSQMDKETAHLDAIHRREEMASVALASLEEQLNRIKSEIAGVQAREKEERERSAELPKQLEEAAREADEAKAVARTAREELDKARVEAKEANTGATCAETKLASVRKEIEAAKAGEKLALAAITALEESSPGDSDSDSSITLSLDEYYMLSKRAHEAEEEARSRVEEAMSQMEIAKESELRSLNKLEEVSREVSQRRDALETATHKADEATRGKLSVEQELRKWREEHQERRNAAESNILHQRSSSPRFSAPAPNEAPAPDHTRINSKKKKKSFFPRFFMFLGRRKTHHAASSTKTD